MKVFGKKMIRWFMHPLLWAAFFLFKVVLMVLAMDTGPTPFEGNEGQIIALYLGTLINALIFYLGIHWLIPRFLQAKKLVMFWMLSLMLLIALTCSYLWIMSQMEAFYGTAKNLSVFATYNFGLFGTFNLFFNIFFGVLAFCYRCPFRDYPGRLLWHVTAWLGFFFVLLITGLQWGPMSMERGNFLIPLCYGMLINAILFYINAYWAIPVLLYKKKRYLFWISSLVIWLGLSTLEMSLDYFYLSYTDTLKPPPGPDPDFDDWRGLAGGVFLFGSVAAFNLFYWSLAFLYRWPIDMRINERQKQQLVQEKLRAELDLLKSQLNPHFLFNGINSIYHMIGEDDESARRILMKFADLLRYQLYECNEPFIPLSKELNYLRSFLSIEEIRKGEDAVIAVKLPGEDGDSPINDLKIAPLLMGPLVENAFKYLSLHSERDRNKVNISMALADNRMNFRVENTFDPNRKPGHLRSTDNGIGLENVKRRLNLIYPDQHQIEIAEREDVFFVELEIVLK